MASIPLKLPSGRPSALPTSGASALSRPMPQADGDSGGGEPGDGSKQSGYAGPEFGPFSCSNCTHFDGQGSCDHPEVINDPEVNGQVEADGCCNFFRSKTAHGGEGQSDQATQGGQGDESDKDEGAAGEGTAQRDYV